MFVGAAFGTLAFTVLAPLALPLAVGTAIALACGPRMIRARSRSGIGAGLLLAGGGAAAAGAILEQYQAAVEWSVWLSALTVATLLSALHLFVRIDDPIAQRFRACAFRSSGAFRRKMVRALVLRRRSDRVTTALSPRARNRSERAWRTLAKAAEERTLGARATREVLDGRIDTYLRVLQRSLVAARRAQELSEDLDDAVLAEFRMESEDLVATASALQEVRDHQAG